MSEIVEELIGANEQSDFELVKPSSPDKGIVVVTCMDARINPYEVLGLSAGNAHILRNAGGVLTDDIVRSVALSQQAFKTTHVIVMQHTDCGLCKMDEAASIQNFTKMTGQKPEWQIGSFSDPYESVRSSVEKLESSPFIERKDNIYGFVYNVETGKIETVKNQSMITPEATP